MKTINLNKQEGVNLMLFPDNQPHVIIDTENIKPSDEIRVVASLRTSLEVMNLLALSNALDNYGAKKVDLVIP